MMYKIKTILKAKWSIKLIYLIWLFSAFNLLVFNFPFFRATYKVNSSIATLVVLAIVAFFLFNFLFSILFYKRTTKFFILVFLLLNSVTLYYIATYHIFIDKAMIRNVLETDTREVSELFNISTVLYFLFLGVLPSFIILFKVDIIYPRFWKSSLYRIANIVLSILVIITIVLSIKSVPPFVRAHKTLQYLLIPSNYVISSLDLLARTWKSQSVASGPKKDIAPDAMLDPDFYNKLKKPNLFIFVVGEASRAASFSLNGYKRKTSAYLEKYPKLINFQEFYSCGTETAVSVPCMFSHLTRKNFQHEKAISSSNVVDILHKMDFGMFWLDNNSGCKKVCDAIPYTSYGDKGQYCKDGNCFEQQLLEGLEEKIDKVKTKTKTKIIFLHLYGSHGPTYYKRVPDKFIKYRPICLSSNLSGCSKAEIINAYDNTINYTSYFLSRVIDLLKKKEKEYNTGMFYVADHGESTGEYGIYLHGMPYLIAPDYQKHVSAMMWFSDSFLHTFKLNQECLRKKEKAHLSHDYLFSSLLGLFRVQTKIYDKNLDLFYGCYM